MLSGSVAEADGGEGTRSFSAGARGIGLVLAVVLGASFVARAEGPQEKSDVTAQTASPHDGHAGTPSALSPSTQNAVHAGHAAPATEVDAYSLFMHHTVGAWFLVIGSLLLAHRFTQQRFATFRIGIGAAWFLLGVFLFVKSDPEGWPLGPAGFLESFTMPSRWDWIQHKLLDFIPMLLGLCVARGHTPMPRAAWIYAAAGLTLLGGLAVTVHQHSDHPGMHDIVNVQHRWLAVSALFITGSLILDIKEQVTWRVKPYLLPAGLLLVGLQMTFYVE